MDKVYIPGYERDYPIYFKKGPNKGSIYKGIKNDYKGRWSARISIDRKNTYLGIFATPEEAARAYDIAALKTYGANAYLNFPERINEPAPIPRTHQERGSRSTTGFRGVLRSKNGTYEARIRAGTKHIVLGRYNTALDAARICDAKAVELFGEAAILNCPELLGQPLPERRLKGSRHQEKRASGNFKGITRTNNGRFTAQIYIPETGYTKNLGTFDSPEIAAIVYDKAAVRLHGPETYVNFPTLITEHTRGPTVLLPPPKESWIRRLLSIARLA